MDTEVARLYLVYTFETVFCFYLVARNSGITQMYFFRGVFFCGGKTQNTDSFEESVTILGFHTHATCTAQYIWVNPHTVGQIGTACGSPPFGQPCLV